MASDDRESGGGGGFYDLRWQRSQKEAAAAAAEEARRRREQLAAERARREEIQRQNQTAAEAQQQAYQDSIARAEALRQQQAEEEAARERQRQAYEEAQRRSAEERARREELQRQNQAAAEAQRRSYQESLTRAQYIKNQPSAAEAPARTTTEQTTQQEQQGYLPQDYYQPQPQPGPVANPKPQTPYGFESLLAEYGDNDELAALLENQNANPFFSDTPALDIVRYNRDQTGQTEQTEQPAGTKTPSYQDYLNMTRGSYSTNTNTRDLAAAETPSELYDTWTELLAERAAEESYPEYTGDRSPAAMEQNFYRGRELMQPQATPAATTTPTALATTTTPRQPVTTNQPNIDSSAYYNRYYDDRYNELRSAGYDDETARLMTMYPNLWREKTTTPRQPNEIKMSAQPVEEAVMEAINNDEIMRAAYDRNVEGWMAGGLSLEDAQGKALREIAEGMGVALPPENGETTQQENPGGSWQDNLGWTEDRNSVDLGNDVMDQFADQFEGEPGPGFTTKAEMSVRNRLNRILDSMDANDQRRNWVEEQTKNIDWGLLTDEEANALENSLFAQYDQMLVNGEITNPTPRSPVTSNDINARKEAFRKEQEKEIAETADWTKNFLDKLGGTGGKGTTGENSVNIVEEAKKAAEKEGFEVNTPEYWERVNSYVQSYQTPEERAALQRTAGLARADERRDQDLMDYLVETGVSAPQAERMVENPNDYGWNYKTGRPTYTGERADSRLGWADAIGSERLMDDLMLYGAPAVDEKGNMNTAAQALFLGLDENGNVDPTSQYLEGLRQYPDLQWVTDPTTGERTLQFVQPNPTDRNVGLSADQKLHLFDRTGAFANNGSGVSINDLFADLMAANPAYAQGSPLAETANMTVDQFLEKYGEFMDQNPLIKMMFDLGLISDQDIRENFFKNVGLTSGAGTGSGSGKGSGYRYGGGYGGYGGYGYGGSSYTPRTSVNTPSLSSGSSASRASGYATRNNNAYQNYTNPRVNKTPTVKKQQEQRVNNIMKNWSF